MPPAAEVPWVGGSDTARRELVVGGQTGSGQVVGKVQAFPNDLPGAARLEAYLGELLSQDGFTQVVIGTEATSFYDFHILEFLAQSDVLASYHPQFYRLNPKLVSGFKKIHTSRAKNDSQDALLIASRLRFGELPGPYQPNMAHLPMQRLTRFREHTVQTLTAEQNHFLAMLFLKFSAYTQVKPFSHTFGATSVALIEECFSPDELLQMSIEPLPQFLLEKGKNRFPNPEAVLRKVKQVARESSLPGSRQVACVPRSTRASTSS